MPSTSPLPWVGQSPPPRTGRTPRRRRFRLRRFRRVGAALLVGLAAWLTIGVLRPAPPPHGVVTVTRDLPAGHVLAAGDVAVVRAEDDLRPEGAPERPDQVVGRRLSRAAPARTVLTEAGLATSRDLASHERAVHVPLGDPGALNAIHPGDRIDLLDSRTGQAVARAVRVLVVDDPAAEKGGHGLLVAAPETQVPRMVPSMGGEGPGVTAVLRTP